MRLLVCGGREFTDVEYAVLRLHRFNLKQPVSTLISGMARNGDMIGVAWAEAMDIPVDPYPITKDDWASHGKAAGPIRNQVMLDEGKPDQVIALPGGNGTAHMAAIARVAGIPVIEYRYRYFSRARDPVDAFLSNFYRSEQVDGDGLIYQSNEHWYQAEKTTDPDIRQWIVDSPDPATAKKRGNAKKVPLRPDWGSYKIDAMTEGLRMKFPNRANLSDLLIHTGDDYLVEFAPWGDRFWGVDKDKKGENWLGRLLMRRRDEILTGVPYE
jgi:ribA/ribD-fused uncharacterized protein